MSRRYALSSIGKKQVMGISGLLWCGFVLSHMVGNLLYLVGPDAYNAYGHAITGNKMIYYPMEFGLLLTLTLHVVFAILVAKGNRAARPVGYAVNPGMGTKGYASIASKTMAYTGFLVLVFIILHLITFRFGVHYDFEHNGVMIRDLHRLMTETFQSVGYTAWYLVCLFVLGLHLSHAFWSSLQTMALIPPGRECALRCLSQAFGWSIAIGFAINPIIIHWRG